MRGITTWTHFSPVFISCLDESRMKRVNKYTCLGFIFVLYKPWKFGNEWHTIACSDSDILFYVELVGGKDAPADPPPKYSDKGKPSL